MNKKLKILIIILLGLLVLWGIILGIDYFRIANLKMPVFVKADETADDCGTGSDLEQTGEINTVLTLEDEIQNDAIWCGTFQLIWNDLKNDLAKQDIVFSPQMQVIENLNKETFTTKDISEEYYYKKVGSPSIALKEEIEKAIKDKFNEKSKILDDFEWEGRDPKDYFLYAEW